MKILRLRSYYFPEISAASHLIDDLDDSFAEAGFTNVNIAPTPSRGISKEERKKYSKIKYEESHDGHQVVYRFSMFAEGKNVIQRAARYFLCGMIEYFKASKFTDTDLIFSSSTPPIQGLVSAMVAHKLRNKTKRVIPFVYNLQDVFPDSLVTTGLTHNGSVIWKIGRKIEDYTYRNANDIITISNSIKNNLIHKGVAPNKITVVSNWIDLNCVHPVPRTENSIISEYSINTDKFLVVYAGNLGAAQGAEVILDAAKLLNYEKRIHIVVFGGGSNYSEFKMHADLLSNISVFRLLPVDRVSEVYSLGDVSLITSKKGTGKAGLPSKTWSIMACNTPIIASFDTDSELAEALSDSGAGTCVKPGDAQLLADAILKNFFKWTTGESYKGNYRKYVEEYASKEMCVAKYVGVLKREYEKSLNYENSSYHSN